MNRIKHKVLHGVARVTNRLRRDISIVNRRGLVWALSKKNFVDRALLNGYYYETDRLERCSNYVMRYNIEYFLDICANFGLYTVHLIKNTALREAYAFEPVRQNFNQLCTNIFLNRLDRIVTPYNIGLSNEDTTKTIYIDSLSTGISKFADWSPPATKKTKHREYYSEAVPIRRLDGILDWKNKYVLAKIDVEGHEVEVLQGMASLLSRNKFVLQIEIQPGNEQAVRVLMLETGYSQVDNLGWDWYFSNL
jgi:FkbM family methyltransferase